MTECPSCGQVRLSRPNDYICINCREDDPVAEFAAFCHELVLENGNPMELYPAQHVLLRDYFAGATESLVIMPKKNGKTTLVGALVLHRLLVNPDAEVFGAAAAKEQASIMYRQCEGFIRRSAGLSDYFIYRPSTKEVRRRDGSGFFKALASDTANNDGLLPDLAIVDELHRHKSPELYGLFRDGLGPKNGQMITISTAGADEESPLGQLRTKAYKLPHVKRQGAYRYAKNASGSFAMHEFAVAPDLDVMAEKNLELVLEANPAPWHTVDSLRDRRDSPSTTEAQFRRFAAGQWVRGEGAAIDPWLWDALVHPMGFIPPGSQVWVGVDLARREDTSAFVPLMWESHARRVIGAPTILTPPPGGFTEFSEKVAALEELAQRYDVQGVVFDPNAQGEQLMEHVQKTLRLRFIQFDQKPHALARADGRLLEAIRRKQIVHDGHEELRSHVLNAVEHVMQGGEAFYFDRPKGKRKPIDALRAVSMAHDVALVEAETPRRSRGFAFY